MAERKGGIEEVREGRRERRKEEKRKSIDFLVANVHVYLLNALNIQEVIEYNDKLI